MAFCCFGKFRILVTFKKFEFKFHELGLLELIIEIKD